MVRVIPQQRERAVIFRDSCRPEWRGLFELHRGMAGIVFPEAVLFARGQLDFRRQIRIRLPENLGVVNDFIERLDPSGGDIRLDFPDQMIQTSGDGVRFNLFVPILPESVMQAMNQIPLFLGRKLFNGRLDFQHCAHADKIRCKSESASAEMPLEFTLWRAMEQFRNAGLNSNVSRAVSVGLEKAAREMLRLMENYLDRAGCLFL